MLFTHPQGILTLFLFTKYVKLVIVTLFIGYLIVSLLYITVFPLVLAQSRLVIMESEEDSRYSSSREDTNEKEQLIDQVSSALALKRAITLEQFENLKQFGLVKKDFIRQRATNKWIYRQHFYCIHTSLLRKRIERWNLSKPDSVYVFGICTHCLKFVSIDKGEAKAQRHLDSCLRTINKGHQDGQPIPTSENNKPEDARVYNSLVVSDAQAKDERMAKAMFIYIMKGMKPFNTVDDPLLRNIVLERDPSANFLSSRTIMRTLEVTAETAKQDLNELMMHVRFKRDATLMFDEWTSSSQTYIGYAACYVTRSFEKILFPIGVFTHKLDAKTADATFDEIGRHLRAFGLFFNQFSWFVTDGCSTNKKIMENKDRLCDWMHCTLHKFQLSVRDAMESWGIMNQVNRFISEYGGGPMRSAEISRFGLTHGFIEPRSSDLVGDDRSIIGNNRFVLERENVTRWNSSLKSMLSILKNKDLLNEYNRNHGAESIDFSGLERCTETLNLIEKHSKLLQNEESGTISIVPSLLAELYQSCQNPTTRLDIGIRISIERRWSDLLVTKPIIKASLIDPRVAGSMQTIIGKLGFLGQGRDDQLNDIKGELLIDARYYLEEHLSQEVNTKTPLRHAFDTLSSEVQTMDSIYRSFITAARQWVIELRNEGKDELEVNPFEFWINNSNRFAPLEGCARRYLCIPAGSDSVERLFSRSGYINRKNRSCMLPENLERAVFLSLRDRAETYYTPYRERSTEQRQREEAAMQRVEQLRQVQRVNRILLDDSLREEEYTSGYTHPATFSNRQESRVDLKYLLGSDEEKGESDGEEEESDYEEEELDDAEKDATSLLGLNLKDKSDLTVCDASAALRRFMTAAVEKENCEEEEVYDEEEHKLRMANATSNMHKYSNKFRKITGMSLVGKTRATCEAYLIHIKGLITQAVEANPTKHKAVKKKKKRTGKKKVSDSNPKPPKRQRIEDSPLRSKDGQYHSFFKKFT